MVNAGLIIIGDEILSGKTADENAPFLIAELRKLGLPLVEIAVISDDLATIAETVRRFAGRYTHVFTSGGVGPTHDDLTIAGVARAFDVAVERHAELEALLVAYYRERGLPLVDRNLRMADVPHGVTLITGPDLRWPVMLMANVYILPGIPEVFRRKFTAIRERFRDRPFHLRQIFVSSEEGEIARHLDEVAARHPEVAIGSYPLLAPAEDGHRVKVTLEGKEQAAVEQAEALLAELLGAAVIVRRS
jgi:molybdenum cofactor synthesis domain-containing protein